MSESLCVRLLSDETPPEGEQACCCKNERACFTAVVEATWKMMDAGILRPERIRRLNRGNVFHHLAPGEEPK